MKNFKSLSLEYSRPQNLGRNNKFADKNTIYSCYLVMMNLKFFPTRLLLTIYVFFSQRLDSVQGHGFMYEPVTRNYYAHTNGLDWGTAAGKPETEYCQHCLNRLAGVCGISEGGADYDAWVDSLNNPMPWISQETYTEGDVIVVKSHLASVCIWN